MEKKTMYLAIAVVAIIIVAGVGVALMKPSSSSSTSTVTIKQKGSDTMLELCQLWAEAYNANNSNIEVEVTGGGSGVGLQALIAGTTDIADSSRQINSTESAALTSEGITALEIPVAIDGVAIIINSNNGVSTLTLEQLRGIYNGTYTNWNQVGGSDLAITLYGRQSTSGTYAYFQEVVLKKGAYSTNMNELQGNSAIVEAVKDDAGGIGYVGIGYAKGATGISILNISKTSSSTAYSPLYKADVLNGNYPLARYLYLYTSSNISSEIKTYILWILSSAGQKIAEDTGFYALENNTIEDAEVTLGVTPSSVTLTEKGSDTMLELCQLWSEDFNANYSWIDVEVSGGGSGVGIQALQAGQVDMAQASRQMTSAEIATAEANGIDPVEFKVALDGIAIITSSSNGVTTLTLEQLRGIYNGTYTNWDQVGGSDLAITLYGRQSTSGTYAYFQEVVLNKGAYSTNMNMLQGNSAIVEAVKDDAGGIGYVGIGYAKEASGINVLNLKHNATATAYSPLNTTAVLTFKYDLARYLYIYTDGTPTGAEKRWLEWILSTDGGQKVATEAGFISMPAETVAAMKAKLG